MVQQKTKKLVEVVSKRYDWKFPALDLLKLIAFEI